MNTIKCHSCGEEVEITEAITKELEKTILANERTKHQAELEQVKRDIEATQEKRIAEIEEKAQAKASEKLSLQIQEARKEAEESKKDNRELRGQLSKLMEELREARRSTANAEIEMQKKLDGKEAKIREEAAKQADEKQRLNLAAKDKTISDLQKALDEAQRKAAQGSQQLQGEIMELDFEATLTSAFPGDVIEPIAKGVKGGDLRQIVKSPRGMVCGVILWEIKRTQNWAAGWVPKLKADLRAEKADVAVIVSESLPKEMTGDMGFIQDVWACKPGCALPSVVLLRKGLLDTAYQKAITNNRESKADGLFDYITSRPFVQQVEVLLETYQSSMTQVMKERTAFERSWADREAQARKSLISVANIIGSMENAVGRSMPPIKGLELLETGTEQSLPTE